MQHVDDGALHAWLDGALDHLPEGEGERIRRHLEVCPACAERLEEERRVREEASEILAGAVPAVDAIPPLAELRARADARRRGGGPAEGEHRPAPGRGLGRMQRLAWAASVVLALGTGWVLRGGVPGTGAVGDAGLADEAPPGAEAPSGPATFDDAGSGAVARPQEERAAAPPQAVSRPASPPPAVSRPATPVTAASEEARRVEGGRVDEPPVADGAVAAASKQREPEPDRAAAVSPSPPPAPEDRAAAAASGDAAPVEVLAAEAIPAERRGADLALPADVALSVVDLDAPTIPLGVPGLETLDVTTREAQGGRMVVEVRQGLDDDTELTVFHATDVTAVLQVAGGVPRAGSRALMDASGQPVEGAVAARVAGGWVVLRAPVAAERLEALLERLLEAGRGPR